MFASFFLECCDFEFLSPRKHHGGCDPQAAARLSGRHLHSGGSAEINTQRVAPPHSEQVSGHPQCRLRWVFKEPRAAQDGGRQVVASSLTLPAVSGSYTSVGI